MRKRCIVFLTGTRADFGKLLPLMKAVDESPDFHCAVFVTGMHTLQRYGYTAEEVRKSGLKDIHVFINQFVNEPMDLVLANTVQGLARYVQETKPDMLVVHGDRVEALAGAIVGVMRNLLVCHIEGGEVSGTVDELVRHSISKLAQAHCVSNEEAARRLIQMGEDERAIFVIGSPEIDVLAGSELPEMKSVKSHYEINFDRYAVAIFHPVTTEVNMMRQYAKEFVDALVESDENYVIVYPNNDSGSEFILNEYKRIEESRRFRIIPSIRFMMFLTLMKNADFLIGNSSAGVREAPFFGVPTVNIGSRQFNRFSGESVVNVGNDKDSILDGIGSVKKFQKVTPVSYFGDGNSAKKFASILEDKRIWSLSRQKYFRDIIY